MPPDGRAVVEREYPKPRLHCPRHARRGRSRRRAADEDIIAELAALGPLAYAKRRKAASAEIGVGVGELDRIVAKARGEASAEAGPKTHQRWQIEPWEEPVATANLLDDLREKYAAHVILPEHGAEVMALWVLHAWSLDASYISPFLRLTSPEPRCGKSRALTLLYKTMPRTTLSSNISAAATAGSSTPATHDRCPAAADERSLPQSDIELMTEKEDFGFKPPSRLEQIGDKHCKQAEDRDHQMR